MSDLLIVPVLLIVLALLFVLVRVFVRTVVLPVLDCADPDFLPSLVVVLVRFDLESLAGRVLL